MVLSTFGAIIGFATEMIQQTETVYKTIIQKAKDPILKEALQAMLGEERKNHSLMEQTRRENVTEMILEPVAGLHQDDYEIELKITDQPQDVDLLKMALILEEREQGFFNDVSDKVPFPEVVRIFRKTAEKKEKTINQLKALAVNQL